MSANRSSSTIYKNFVMIISVISMAIFLLFLTGCGVEIESENGIKNRIISYYSLYSMDTLDFTIQSRDTDKKEGFDTIECSLTLEDADYRYVRHYVLNLVLDSAQDNKSWVLNYITCDNETISPLHGPNDAEIIAALNGVSFTINDDNWSLSADSEYVFSTRNTDIENGTDDIVVDFCENDEAMRAKGSFELSASWDGSRWVFGNPTPNADFYAEYKENCAPEFSSERILADIISKGIVIGEQTIALAEDNVSDFAVIREAISDKGCFVQKRCSFTVDKGYISFAAESVVSYTFSNGIWIVSSIESNVTVSSIDVEGIWKGEYMAARGAEYPDTAVVFSLENFASDGSFSGVMTITPYAQTVVEYGVTEGSFKVTGALDRNTLSVVMTYGDWIVTPYAYAKFSFKGQLLVDDHAFDGRIAFTAGYSTDFYIRYGE